MSPFRRGPRRGGQIDQHHTGDRLRGPEDDLRWSRMASGGEEEIWWEARTHIIQGNIVCCYREV